MRFIQKKKISFLAMFGINMSHVIYANTEFNLRNVHDHIKALASDDFEGRAPLTTGETKTLDYLDEQYKKLGLVFVPGFSSFRQNVPLAHIKTNTEKIMFGEKNFKPFDDITIESNDLNANLKLDNIPVVFVGYGISSDKWQWDDYKNLDVKGKIVITLVNDPGYRSSDKTVFNGKDMTYFGRWTYKFEEARRRGALGAFVIHETAAAGYGWHVVSSRKDGHYIVTMSDTETQYPPLMVQGWLSEESAKNIFQASGFDYSQLKELALSPGRANRELDKSSFNLTANNQIKTGITQNSCAILPGQTLSDEYVLLSAHWDHLGVDERVDGSRDIYRGAIDNGSGLASILELIRYFRSAKPLDRSIMICSFSAEEQGLLGAKYFVNHSPIPLNSIKGVINLDCMNMGQVKKEVVLYGKEEGQLAQVLNKLVKEQNRIVIDDPMGDKGYFFRSDHYPFVQRKIPALLFLDIGFSNPEYLTNHYHRPSDQYNPEWTLEGLAVDLDLFKRLVIELGNN